MNSWTYYYPYRDRVVEGATKILKDGTNIVSGFRKKLLVFERCNCRLAGPGGMCLKLSPSGGHVSTSGTALYQRGKPMPS